MNPWEVSLEQRFESRTNQKPIEIREQRFKIYGDSANICEFQ